MQVPVQIAFEDIGHSDVIEARVREETHKLEQFYQRITSARVVIGRPQHRCPGNKTSNPAASNTPVAAMATAGSLYVANVSWKSTTFRSLERGVGRFANHVVKDSRAKGGNIR